MKYVYTGILKLDKTVDCVKDDNHFLLPKKISHQNTNSQEIEDL